MSRPHSWSKALSRDPSTLGLSYACRRCGCRRESASGPKGGFRWMYHIGTAETVALPKCMSLPFVGPNTGVGGWAWWTLEPLFKE